MRRGAAPAIAMMVNTDHVPSPCVQAGGVVSPNCHCACSVVDVGLNDGKTLLSWVYNASAPPSRMAAIRECVASGSACYYGFEANPIHSSGLSRLQRHLRRERHRVALFTETAFSTAEGNATFYSDDHIRHDNGERGVGSTLIAGMEAIVPVNGHWYRAGKAGRAFKAVTVRTVHGARFLRSVLATSDRVALKLDIEGLEFDWLRDTLVSEPRVLCGLDVLAIEYHAYAMAAASADRASTIPVREARVAFEWLLTRPPCNLTLVYWD